MPVSDPAALARNLESVRARIAAAAARAGRDPAAITLVAVTKYVDADTVRVLRELGVTHLGENRVEHAREKIAAVDDAGIVWHMVGNIQRRKAREAVRLFDRIDALDRLSLAETLQKRCVELDTHTTVLVEVNVSGETAKHGFAPDEVADVLSALALLDRITVRGLMTMAPHGAEAGRVRGLFDELAALAAAHRLPDVSMGMSGDFELAVEAGATEVRVGSALFA